MASATFSWIGGSTGAFTDPANWSQPIAGGNRVPGPSDYAIVEGTRSKRGTITLTGNGTVTGFAAGDVIVAGTIDASGLVDIGAPVVIATGGALDTGNVQIDFDSRFSIGGFVTTTGTVTDSYSSPVYVGVSTGEAFHMGWTVSSFFYDQEAAVTVQHSGTLSVDALKTSGGIDLSLAQASLTVTSDGTVTTSGVMESLGSRVTISDGGRVQATGSKFGATPFGDSYTEDGLVSADFEGETSIDLGTFDGSGAIIVGYQNLYGKTAAKVNVGSGGHVEDSFTLIANGAIALTGTASWSAGGGASKNGMNGVVELGLSGAVPGAVADFTIGGSASLIASGLTIDPNGKLVLGTGGKVLLGSGSAHAGEVVVGKGGKLTLDGAKGSYTVKTAIDGGTMLIAGADISGKGTITFGGLGGQLDVSAGAAVHNTIDGFSHAASIVLYGVTTTSHTFKNDVLTLKDKSKVVDTIRFSGAESLVVSKDGALGTKITVAGKTSAELTASTLAAPSHYEMLAGALGGSLDSTPPASSWQIPSLTNTAPLAFGSLWPVGSDNY